MILREMPAIWDERFRPGFYARWVRENCIVAARTRQAELPLFEQRLSVKAAWGGSEDYFVDRRRVTVDDDNYVVFNDGRRYASRIHSAAPVVSFAIFFRPRFAAEVAASLKAADEALLENPQPGGAAEPEFPEHLHPHDATVSPMLRYLHGQVAAGEDDEGWYEERLYELLARMLRSREDDRRALTRIPAARPNTRHELYRRVGLAADFIHSHYAEPIALPDIAAAARLSPFHCLRVFRSVHGVTPVEYLTRKRVRVAQRLLESPQLCVEDVAALVGLNSRTTLFRQMKKILGTSPRQSRRSPPGS